MDTADPDLIARLAALDDSERQAVMSFLAQPDENTAQTELSAAGDSAQPGE